MNRNRHSTGPQQHNGRPHHPHQHSHIPAFLQSPTHARSSSDHTHSYSSFSPSQSAKITTTGAGPLDHHTTSSSLISTAATTNMASNERATKKSTAKISSVAPPVYTQDRAQRKRISQRYCSSTASSYTAYSSALAASYHQHQHQLSLYHQHTHS